MCAALASGTADEDAAVALTQICRAGNRVDGWCMLQAPQPCLIHF